MSWHGSALEFLRREAGLTHQELIDAIDWDVKPATISRYEHEERTPSDDQVAELAGFFRVSPEYFTFPEAERGALATDAHMRRQATERTVVWSRVEAKLINYRRHLSMLLGKLLLRPDFEVPSFDPIDVSPEEAARRVRALWRVPIGPVASMVRTLEAAGCLVIEEDFGTRRIDGMSVWGKTWPIILLNSEMPADRKRLTMAHELGHLVLHSRHTVEDPETDANKFAAEFLMPETLVKPVLKSSKIDISTVAALKIEWKVSMQAIFERAFSLGLVSKEQRTSFYIAMNKRGWKTNEPNAGYITEPVPSLIATIVKQMESSGYPSDEIARIAGYQELPPQLTGERPKLRIV